MNLFAYGTLMDRRVMTKITGRSFPPSVPATLHGYRKVETTLGYPIVLPETGATCTGVVYFSLSAGDWEQLDRYEDLNGSPPLYTRKLVSVVGTHGTISAQVYIGNLSYFRTRLKQ